MASDQRVVADCLRSLATRELPTGRHFDATGEVRLVMPVIDWQATSGSPLTSCASRALRRRPSRAALEDLKRVAPPQRLRAARRATPAGDTAVTRSYDE
ncbi:MAG: hypothetical protein ACR2H2_03195 [Solirubrobacteraceae bacterium]